VRSTIVEQKTRPTAANFFEAFPDASYTLNDLFFSGDKGACGRFERDKLAEDWVEYDRYNLFRQLGAA
jgi:predicted ester cyclase